MATGVPARDEEPALPGDAVEVGRVLGAWGLKGWIRVQPFSSDARALFSSRRWFIRPPATSGPNRFATPAGSSAVGAGAMPACAAGRLPALGPGARTALLPGLLRITLAREQGDAVVAAAQELPDRAAAEAIRGARVFIARSSFPSAGAGEYYWVDLIGLSVVNREGHLLGVVTDLLDTGAHSVLRIERPDAPAGAALDAAERLIPFVAAYIDDVNLAERRITVDWGLDY